MSVLEALAGGVIISCQPLMTPEDPMNHPDVQARLAESAVRGGAVGIRANGVADVRAIRRAVTVPLIGLWKDTRHGTLADSVVITPTATHAAAVLAAGADIVAVDATDRPRPDGRSFADLVERTKTTTAATVLADVSNLKEGIAAVEAGADALATTLAGLVTPAGAAAPEFDPAVPALTLIADLVAAVPGVPVIAEGRFRTPEQVELGFRAGAHAVVVGNAVTSPEAITRTLVGSQSS